MLAVTMLPAGNGDALVVDYGTENHLHHILIDAGTVNAWDEIREELLSRRWDRYEIFVITHIDEDHIGGAISLLDDPDLSAQITYVWFNGYKHCDQGGNVLGPIHGEQLTKRLVEGDGLRWNQGPADFIFTPPIGEGVGGPIVVPTTGELPCIPLPGNASIVLLSPYGADLEALATDWAEVVTTAHLVPGTGASGHNPGSHPYDKDFEELPDPLDAAALKALAKKASKEDSKSNASSIAFVLEYAGRRVLFAADANRAVLTTSLQRYADRVGEPRPRFDLVKLAHHGSNANISNEMLELMDCRRFLISTNGDNFAHPHDAAIAKVIRSCDGPVTFYCNYRTPRTAAWQTHGPAVGATFQFPLSGQHVMRVEV